MRGRKRICYVAVLTAAMILFACAPGMESYRQGEDLYKKGNWEGAIAFYKDALAKEPGNEKYRQALKEARKELATEHYQRGVDYWSNAAAKDYQAVARTLAIMEKARELDPENADVADFYRQLLAKKEELGSQARKSYELGNTALENQRWLEAAESFRRVSRIYPNYEDTKDKLARAVASGCDLYYKEGVSAIQAEDWKSALSAFGKVLALDSSYKNTRSLIEQVKKNDNPRYFLNRASEMMSAQDWDRAVDFYERALAYLPGDATIQSALADVKLKAGRYYFNQATQHVREGRFYLANEEFRKAASYSPSLANTFFFKEAKKNFCDKLFERASQYVSQEMHGNALAWYWQLNNLDPNYEGLFYKIQEIEDLIKKRLRKAIAVFDFSSPSYNPDAGRLASSTLITYLFNNSSGDIRILERQDLQSILKEMNLEQAGLVGDMEAARRVGRMIGIDIFIMGNVLIYKAETEESKGAKTAKVQIGTKIQENPEYLIWKARNPTPTSEELANAPDAVILVPEYRYENYTVGRTKLRAAVSIYYKIIDAKKGEIIAADTLKRQQEVADDWNDGISEAGISYNPVELPTESELLEEVTSEVVRDLALVVLKPFESLQTTYFEEAESLRRRRYHEQAVEKYMDSIFDERIKGIESPVSKRALELIDQFISQS